jgi:hypothetical protein
MTGSGTEPDPATYCPANGYIIDPDLPTEPTITIPADETDEKIVLLVSSQLDSAISFTCTTSAGQFTTAVYDLSDTLISTVNTNSNTTLNLNLNSALGTTHPDGYSLFKIIITPTTPTEHLRSYLIKSRSGYAANGWPLLEAHFYTPELTSMIGAFSSYCKMLRYLKFYTACDSLTTIATMCGTCSLLKEVYLPSSMNALTTANGAFTRAEALRVIEWPNSLPECTDMARLYQYGGLKQMTPTINTLPASLPKCTTFASMFEYNYVIEELEISNDLPLLVLCTNFVLWCTKIKYLKFTGTVGDPVNGCNFQWLAGYNYESLTEVQFPPIIPLMVGSSQATQFKQCYVLKKIILPSSVNYISTTFQANILGRYDNCISLEEITEITSGSFDSAYGGFFTATKKIASFWQPLIKMCYFISSATSTAPYLLSSFEIDWSAIEIDNDYSQTINFSFRYCNFGLTEINRIFTALPTLTGSGTIDFRNNPGYAACNKTIATAKGWTVL